MHVAWIEVQIRGTPTGSPWRHRARRMPGSVGAVATRLAFSHSISGQYTIFYVNVSTA
jgi:hypothetical protein